MKQRILIIDDEEAICDACFQVFTGEGYDVATSLEGQSGLQKFDAFQPDIVFVDLKMPGISGMEVIERIRQKDENAVLVVITGYATIDSAVESMKMGAFDFLPKPFTPEELNIVTKRALERRRILIEKEKLRIEKEKLRKHFNFMVSHELRTPLVAVMQYCEVLSQGITGTVSSEQQKIIERMKVRLNELLILIDSWLKLSTIEEESIRREFEDCDLVTVIDDVLELMKPLAQQKGVQLTADVTHEALLVTGNKHMLKEVFTNLVNNAIKYNREKGMVTIRTRTTENSYVIDVIDTGIGMTEDEIPRIGEEFYRIKGGTDIPGAGLGLAVVKKIVDIHGGSLEIKSKVNEGSTFSVVLPKK